MLSGIFPGLSGLIPLELAGWREHSDVVCFPRLLPPCQVAFRCPDTHFALCRLSSIPLFPPDLGGAVEGSDTDFLNPSSPS